VVDSRWIWPSTDMNFWKIENAETTVKIQWSHNCFEDYKKLAFQFYECGYKTFEDVISSGHNNVKSDMWFLTGIFLIRQALKPYYVEFIQESEMYRMHLRNAVTTYLCCFKNIMIQILRNI